MTKLRSRPVELKEMLEARERRSAKHRAYVKKYGCPAVLFTMNIPGPEKSGQAVCRCFDKGFQALLHILEDRGIPMCNAEAHYLITGPEGYLAADTAGRTLKELAVKVEELEPEGRLFDIDVLDQDCVPISRQLIGLGERRCFLCGESAKACGRSRRHSVEALMEAVRKIMERGQEAVSF